MIEIRVNGFTCEPGEIEVGAAGSYGMQELHFTFSAEWDGLAKRTTWMTDAGKIEVLLDGLDRCEVPAEATATAGRRYFSVDGMAGGKHQISARAVYKVRETVPPGGENSSTPTDEEMVQALAILEEMKALKTPEVEVGTTKTVAAGNPAKVQNSGTASKAVLDFEIPRGESGVYVGEEEPGEDVMLWIVPEGENEIDEAILDINESVERAEKAAQEAEGAVTGAAEEASKIAAEAVVGETKDELQNYVDAAQAAAGAAAEAAGRAEAAAADVEKAVSDAAGAVREQVAEDANRAEQAAETAENAANTAAQNAAAQVEQNLGSYVANAQDAAQDAEDAKSAAQTAQAAAERAAEEASAAAGGGVTSFNGRGGAVTPQKGDYSADDIAFEDGETLQEKLDAKKLGGGSAETATYDNTTSGLTATNVQDAIDELNDKGTFVVTITSTTAEDGTVTYSSDYTGGEIHQAHIDGYRVIAQMIPDSNSRDIYTLHTTHYLSGSNFQAMFTRVDVASIEVIMIDPVGVATYNKVNPLLKSGGKMTGALILAGDPTANLHAATKQYVDNTAQTKIAGTAGDTVVIGADGTPTAQPLANTDYSTVRVRGICIVADEAVSVPNGCLCGVYTVS